MSFWIFGYGSLIWRPGFSYQARHVAYIEGFERRLDQGSPDHRGTPERLGRVATLARAEGARCGGVVYQVEELELEAVLAALDIREQGGYERITVTAVLAPSTSPASERVESVTAVTWIASPQNPYHLGPAALEAMIAAIEAASGPSGSNVEYVLRLADALLEHRIDDAHITSLAEALRLRLAAVG